MTRALLLLATLLTGCVVLPTTRTSARSAGTEQSALTLGAIKKTTLQTSSSRSDVRVRATRTRVCHRQIFAVTEITKSKGAKLGVDDPRGRAVGVLLAPVTIPISALITGIIVASADDETERVTRPLRTETSECTVDAGGLPIELQFPTGHIYRGTTDANGVLVTAIPVDEPYSGLVLVRGGEQATEVAYAQQLPPITAVRDAVETCRTRYQVTSVTVKLTVDARGVATRVWLSTGSDDVASCVRARIAGVVFPSTLRNSTVVLPFDAPTT